MTRHRPRPADRPGLVGTVEGWWRRLTARLPLSRETRLDVGLVLLLAVGITVTARHSLGDDLGAEDLLPGLVALAPTVARRSRPVAVTLAVAALVVAENVVLGPLQGVGGYAAAVLAAFTVAAHCRLRTALGALVVLLASLGAAHLADPTGSLADLDEVLGLTAGFWAAGRVVRSRQDLVDQLSQQAGERYRRRSAEARAAAAEDGRRSAREVHATLAALVAGMVTAAEDGVGTGRSGAAQRSLARVRQRGTEALVQLGRLEELLVEVNPDEHAWRRTGLPAPQLRDARRLADQLRSAGLDVDVRVDADALDVPADIDVTAYLVLQEALMDSLRRAGRGQVRAHVGLERGDLVVEVVEHDTADAPRRGQRTMPGRLGLEQTRARVTLRGGVVEAPPPDDPLRLVARIPVRHAS